MTNEKIGKVVPLVSSERLMGTMVMCAGLEEVDKKGTS